MRGLDLTLDELYIIRNGLLIMMQNALDAQEKLISMEAHTAIDKEFKCLSEISDKIGKFISEIKSEEQNRGEGAEGSN